MKKLNIFLLCGVISLNVLLSLSACDNIYTDDDQITDINEVHVMSNSFTFAACVCEDEQTEEMYTTQLSGSHYDFTEYEVAADQYVTGNGTLVFKNDYSMNFTYAKAQIEDKTYGSFGIEVEYESGGTYNEIALPTEYAYLTNNKLVAHQQTDGVWRTLYFNKATTN
jgi:hypothetical protein